MLTHFSWSPLHNVRLAQVASDLGPIRIQTVLDALIFISISSIALSHTLYVPLSCQLPSVWKRKIDVGTTSGYGRPRHGHEVTDPGIARGLAPEVV